MSATATQQANITDFLQNLTDDQLQIVELAARKLQEDNLAARQQAARDRARAIMKEAGLDFFDQPNRTKRGRPKAK
jgi:hypothetical protein